MKDETSGLLLQALVECHRKEDDSLIECVSNLQKWDENSLKNYPDVVCSTTIYPDNWVKGSFSFVRHRNGEFAGNGGIIEYKSGEGRYQIHT